MGSVKVDVCKEKKCVFELFCICRMPYEKPKKEDDFMAECDACKEWYHNSQALQGLAPKCKLINMHELINKSTNEYVTLLPCENSADVNNKR